MWDLAVAGEAGVGTWMHSSPADDLIAVVREHARRQPPAHQLLHPLAPRKGRRAPGSPSMWSGDSSGTSRRWRRAAPGRPSSSRPRTPLPGGPRSPWGDPASRLVQRQWRPEPVAAEALHTHWPSRIHLRHAVRSNHPSARSATASGASSAMNARHHRRRRTRRDRRIAPDCGRRAAGLLGPGMVVAAEHHQGGHREPPTAVDPARQAHGFGQDHSAGEWTHGGVDVGAAHRGKVGFDGAPGGDVRGTPRRRFRARGPGRSNQTAAGAGSLGGSSGRIA